MSVTKKNAKKQYSTESLMLRSLLGIVLIALGVLSLLSLLGLVRADAFTAIKRVTLGLGGSLSYGIPIFLIWGGGLLAFSAHRRAPVRALLLLLGVFLCVLGIFDLLATTRDGSLMEYILAQNRLTNPTGVDLEGFTAYVSRCYTVCSTYGQAGGAIGMLLAWPLNRFMGSVAGVVLLSVVSIILLLCLSRFDVAGWYRTLKEKSDAKLEQREQEREQQLMQKEVQKQQEKVRPRSLFGKPPAFAREDDAAQQQPMQYTPQQIQAMQYAAYQKQLEMMNAQNLQQQPAMAQQRTIYDEIIAPTMDMTDNPVNLGQNPYQPRTQYGSKRKKSEPAAEPIVVEELPVNPLPSERKPIEAQRMVQPENPYAKPAGWDAAHTPSQKAQTATRLGQERLDSLHTAQRQPVAMGDSTLMSGKRLDTPELKLPPKKQKSQAEQTALPLELPYQYPTLDLLKSRTREIPDTRAQDAYNGQRLEQTLRAFNIDAQVQHVAHGPAITRFELSLLTSGINVSKIAKLADNIALDLAANGGVRVEVPIPGTNLFGVEIPNDEVIPVPLIDVLTSDEMKANKSPLAVALGKDIAGKPIICDLSKMPHLLIAGQTGSGKSVCINTIINSLLYRTTPKQVRMIMIDPKVVELQCYNVIPHLLIPVVSDPHKASGALAWAVAEMLDRYNRIKTKNVRNIAGYNSKLGPDEEPMPHIVIIIDELSDLMLACRKEVEDSIIRIAQLARAAGIHLIVATQRPTVNVITGLIKANIPSRIAFAVSSQIDSRTILDQNGADKLLGKGDMLYSPTGVAPIRVQGCFLSDAEIENVMSFIERTSSTSFDPNIIEVMESDDEAAISDSTGSEKADDRLPEAIEMVITDGQASISMLQRRMKIGYARAGALIDEMAKRGIVSKSQGSKPREVLMTREQYDQMQGRLSDTQTVLED